MGWLDKANDWLTRPFRAEAPATAGQPRRGGGADDGRPERAPPDTDVTVRYIFSLTNPGIVKPLGDGVPRNIDDPLTLEVADQVLAHFHAHRPEPASFPALATQVIDVAEQEEPDLGKLSRLIEQDAAISSKVLQVANSALYHRDFEITSMRAAVSHLGMFAVANVAVGVACRSLYDGDARGDIDLYPAYWKGLFLQSMTAAYAASQFATERQIGRSDQIFLAGIFHDIGKSLGLRSLCSLIRAKKVDRLDETQVDRVLERVHVAVGTEAHVAWQLPQFLSTICRRHHDDDVVASPDYAELHIIRVVSGLNALRLSVNFDRALSRQVRQSVHALGITPPQLRQLASSIRMASESVADLFRR